MPDRTHRRPMWDGGRFVDVDQSEWRRRSAHGAAASVISQAIRMMVQTGAQIMLARLLTPDAFGLVAMVAPVIGFAQLFGRLGLLESVVQRPEISRDELSALFWINVGLGVALAILLALISPLVAWMYGDPRTETIVQCFGVLLIVGGCSALPMALLNRRLRFITLASIDVATAIVAAAVGLAAAVAGFGYWSLVLMQVANALVILILSWVFAGWLPSWPRRCAGIMSLIRFGSQVTAASLVHALSYSVDDVLVGAAWGPVPLGLYDRGFRLMARPVMQIASPFQRVGVPLLSRLREDPQRYRNAYAHLLRAMLFATTPTVIFAICTAHQLVPLVLGQRWDPAVPFFIWFGVGALLTPINASTNWLFISQGRSAQEMRWNVVSTSVAVCAALAGLPWGATAVAASKVCAGIVLTTPLLWWQVTREGPVRLTDLLRTLYPSVIAGTAAFTTLWFCSPLLMRYGLLGLAATLGISYAAYTVCYASIPEGNRALQALLPLRRGAAAS